MPPKMRRLLLQLLFWGLFTAFMVVLALSYAPGYSGPAVISVLVGVGLWLVSEVLRYWVLRHRWLDLSVGPLGLRLLVAIVLGAVLLQAVLYLVIPAIVRAGWVQMPGDGKPDYRLGPVIGYVANSAFMLLLWSSVWLGRHAWRRARHSELKAARDEGQRQRLELDALKSRLNPHFMFNALNNLRALILEDPQRARAMVTQLSNTLRYALYHSQQERVALSEELAVVDDYLAVEAIHYEERLRVRREIDPPALEAQLPPMLLQLLVENAIKHGIARTPGGGEVQLGARREGRSLILSVRNPGRLTAAEAPADEGAGVGLAYLHARLRQQWPGAAFALSTPAPDVVEARLELPQ